MSTIKAGTTSTTAYQVEADTTGDLVIATGTSANVAMTVNSSGNVGIGTTSPATRLDVRNTASTTGSIVNIANSSSAAAGNIVPIRFFTGNTFGGLEQCAAILGINPNAGTNNGGALVFATSANGTATTPSERARITADGDWLVGTTTADPVVSNVVGGGISSVGIIRGSATSSPSLGLNRRVDDGDLVHFYQAGTLEGTISVSGATVSYNAFAGSHWSQLQDGSKPDILRGTVMESINELCVWPGEQNERLPKSKISDTAGSKKVYGVFMAWDNDWTDTSDMLVTSVGAFICRVNGSVTVQEGDLLESNGDGTARVQADDIIRSSTIGKVTSTVKTHEYDDGSYCVPTVLYCG